jgi:phosphoglycerate dehydrogenase-like enzyme
MRTIFVDCTPELHEVISRRRLPVPAGLEIHVGSPDGEEMLQLCRGADVILVEHSFVPDAMIAALDSGQMGHAALDVFDAEPLPRDDTLTERSNATLTSHAAYMTEEAYCSLWSKALDHLRRIAAAG